MYKFNIDNNCNNNIINIGQYSYNVNEEILNIDKTNHTTNSNTLYLNNLKKLIESLELVDIVQYKDDIICEDSGPINALICKTNLNNVIRRTPYKPDKDNMLKVEILEEIFNSTYEPAKQSELVKTKKHKLDNYKLNVNFNINFFTDTDTDTDTDLELEYVILPDFDIFNIKKIEELQHLQTVQMKKIRERKFTLEDLDIIYYFLSEIKFFCYFSDKTGKNNICLFDGNKSYGVFLEKLKSKIYNFIKSKFLYNVELYLKKINILIDISINKDNIPFIIFNIQNRYNQVYLKPYYDVYRNINLDDYIFNINNDIKNNLFILKEYPRDEHQKLNKLHRENIKEISGKNIKEFKNIFDGYKDWKEIPIENAHETNEYFYLNLLKNNIDNIEIYSNYYALNKYQKNCSRALVISVNGVKYVINIMSNTLSSYNKLKTINKHNIFMNDYNNKLLSTIFKGADNDYYGHNQLPAIVKVIIFKLPNETNCIEYKFFYNETIDQYNIAKTYLKEKAVIKIDLVLTFLWFSEYRKIFGSIKQLINDSPYNKGIKHKLFFLEERDLLKKIIVDETQFCELSKFLDVTDKLLKIPSIAYAMVSFIDYTDNFFLFNKISNIIEIIAYYIETGGMMSRRDLRIKVDNLVCNFKAFEKIMKVNYIKFTRLLDELYSKKITKKTFFLFIRDYIELSQFSFIAWHVPKNLQITNYNKLNEYLDIIINYIQPRIIKGDYDVNSLLVYISKDLAMEKLKYAHTRKTVEPFSNFYELYKNETFIYNIRDAKISQLRELKYLLKIRSMSDYISFFHYFNTDNYNILHCHIYQDYFITQDLTGKKIDMSYGRPVLLSKIETKNNKDDLKPYSDKNMNVSFKENEKEVTSIGKFIQDFKKDHMKGYASRVDNFDSRLVLIPLERVDYLKYNIVELQQLDTANSARSKYIKYKQKYLKLKEKFHK